MYLDLFDALKTLALRYERYCDTPDSHKNLNECIAAHQRALACLDEAASKRIDPLIDAQIDTGNAAREKALEILVNADDELLVREQLLGSRVGFKPQEIRTFGHKARKALRKDGGGLTIAHTGQIRAVLERLHDQVRHAFNTSMTESKAKKDAHRADAKEYVRLQLWMIGAIVVNAEHEDLFHLSYATSVGMSRVKTLDRKALVTRTSDRPTQTDLGDAESA